MPNSEQLPINRVSVITICMNPGAELPRTVDSLAAQTQLIEWIVIDGGSTDGTLEFLKQHQRHPDILISEPDSGIANAFNKGLRHATCNAVCFMNAGDEFATPTALHDIIKIWDHSHYQWIIGGADLLSADGTLLFHRGHRSQITDPAALVRHNCQIVHQAVV